MDFFENGGQEAWVVRIVGSGTLDLPFPADFRGSEASGTKKFALALPELGLLPHTRRDKLHLTALPEKQRVSRVPMAHVEKLMRTKGAYAKDGES